MPIRRQRGTYRIIDIGAGEAEALKKRTKRRPENKYLAIDQAYSPLAADYHVDPKHVVDSGIQISSLNPSGVLQRMKARGQTTDIVNIAMPDRHLLENYDFENLIPLCREVLIPNGKIFLTTNDTTIRNTILRIAQSAGLKIRERQLRPVDRLTYWEKGSQFVTRLELTNTLKKPKK